MIDKSMTYGDLSQEVRRQLQVHTSFYGSAEHLLRIVENLAQALHLEPEGDSGNERLLRHYASVRVVDKPSRQGREAVYTYRHLLQFLTARRLMKQGFALSKIAEFTSVVPTETLQQTLCESPQRSEAELLVAAYKAARRPPSETQIAKSRATVQPASPPSARPDPLYGMADVMHEIEKMRTRFMVEIQEMQDQAQRSLRAMEKTSEVLNRLQVDSEKNLQWVLEERKESHQRLEDHLLRVARMTEQIHDRTYQELSVINARFSEMNDRIRHMTNSIDEIRREFIDRGNITNTNKGNRI